MTKEEMYSYVRSKLKDDNDIKILDDLLVLTYKVCFDEGRALGGENEGWVIATADGIFHSYILNDKELAKRMCSSGEHIVRITYNNPIENKI